MRELLAVVFFFSAVGVFFYSCWRLGRIRSHMRTVVNERLGKEVFLASARGYNRELLEHFRSFSAEGDDSLNKLRRTKIAIAVSFVAFMSIFMI